MTVCPLYIVLATKLRVLNYCCSLTAATAALPIISPLIGPCLFLLAFITTSPLISFAMLKIQQHLFPLYISSVFNIIILTPKNINLDTINLISKVEKFCSKKKGLYLLLRLNKAAKIYKAANVANLDIGRGYYIKRQ